MKKYIIIIILVLITILFIYKSFYNKAVSDSTKIVTTQIKENTIIKKFKDKNGVSVTEISKAIDSNKVVKKSSTTKSNKNLTLMYGYDLRDKKEVYGVSISKEIGFDASVGVFYLTNKTLGVSVGIEF